MASRQAKSSKRAAQDKVSSGSSSAVPSKQQKGSHSSKEAKALAVKAKEELRLHEVIERSIQKALREASLREVPSHSESSPLPAAAPPPPASTPSGLKRTSGTPLPQLSPDRDPVGPPLQAEVHEALFGPPPGPPTPRAVSPVPSTSAPPPPSESAKGAPVASSITPDLAVFIQEAIQKGVQLELQWRTLSWVSNLASSQVDIEGSQFAEVTTPAGVDAPSMTSEHPSLLDQEARDQDLSDDEDLSPDQPSFVGLFKPQLFRSLLHKAKATTCLGVSHSTLSSPGQVADSAIPLFEEPVPEVEEIPGPKLFKDVLLRQWSNPASGPNPNSLDRRLYNLAPDISSLLQVPTIDPPIVALSTPSNLAAPPEDSLRPKEK